MKLNKIIYQPLILLISWIGFISIPFIGFIKYFYITSRSGGNIYIRLGLSLLERSWVVLLPLSFLTIILWIKKKNILNNFPNNKKVIGIVFISSIASVLLSSLLLRKEMIHYPNYLYSQYGLKTGLLDIVLKSSLLMIVVCLPLYFYRIRKLKIEYGGEIIGLDSFFSKETPLNFFKIFPLIGLIIMLWQAVLSLKNVEGYLEYAQQNYGNKFEQYEYITLLKETPSKASIILPPQSSTWPAISNPPVVRYFLYPRMLISGTIFTDRDANEVIQDAYFIELSEDKGVVPWPVIERSNTSISFNLVDFVKYSELEVFMEENGIIIYQIKF